MNPLERFKKDDEEDFDDEEDMVQEDALQQAINATERIPVSREDFWQHNIKTSPPSIELTKEYVEETARINKELGNFSPEQIRAALFRKANELDTLYTQEIALSNISPKEKEYVRTAFQFARESLMLFEYAPIEVQIWWFYQFAFLAYSKVIIPRGVGGFTVKEMNTARGYTESSVSKKSSSREEEGGILDAFKGFFGGFGG